jgi:hypothetical protein
VTAPKTQQPINLSAILSSNLKLRIKKKKIGLKTWFCSIQFFWIKENADFATDTDCQNNCDRYDEQGVVRQFLEP